MRKIITALITAFILLMSSVYARESYTDEYRAELLRLYESLDSQFTELEQTEDADVILRFRDFKVSNRGESVEGAIEYRDFRKIIAMLCGEHPRFLSSVNFLGNTLYPTANPSLMTGIHITRLPIDTTYEDMYEQISAKADEIINENIKDGMNDMEKAFSVYMYLAENCVFNKDSENDERDTIYGSLILNSAACGGFADAYKFIMDKLEIPCEIADSRSVGHLWNYVNIDGAWYHVDASDPLNILGEISSDNFLLTEAERRKILLWGDNEYDWESINKDTVCSDRQIGGSYIFRRLSGEDIKSLTYNNGVWSYTVSGVPFVTKSLNIIQTLISQPLTENGDIAKISDMQNAYAVVYGSPRPLKLYIACYGDNGRLLDFISRDVEYDQNHHIDVSCLPPDGTEQIKLFAWNDLTPLSVVTEINE